ncbi:hypothetical protein G4G27_15580 [Sphingomonas sp. So64.6b]|uniref:hypothetical protein n=1 Tax=Sphingomonas sp. So64.6b TaxID=2997354 RepID=UPI0016022D28|nr:hypothetical protein [Sphingomonas sp. So64.6b]QNA85260.1 hypothetical protein G4G27_15580 [Sphingomonas sp. So64.6b]
MTAFAPLAAVPHAVTKADSDLYPEHRISMAGSDEEIARRALQLQNDGREYSIFELHGYAEWSSRKIHQGESPATMAHLESIGLFMRLEEATAADESLFEEMLDELKFSLGS